MYTGKGAALQRERNLLRRPFDAVPFSATVYHGAGCISWSIFGRVELSWPLSYSQQWLTLALSSVSRNIDFLASVVIRM